MKHREATLTVEGQAFKILIIGDQPLDQAFENVREVAPGTYEAQIVGVQKDVQNLAIALGITGTVTRFREELVVPRSERPTRDHWHRKVFGRWA